MDESYIIGYKEGRSGLIYEPLAPTKNTDVETANHLLGWRDGYGDYLSSGDYCRSPGKGHDYRDHPSEPVCNMCGWILE